MERARMGTGVVVAVVVLEVAAEMLLLIPRPEVGTEVRVARRRSPERTSRIRVVAVAHPERHRREAREPLVDPADPAWVVRVAPANCAPTVNEPLQVPPDSHTEVAAVVVAATAITPAHPVRIIRRREGREARAPSSFAM